MKNPETVFQELGDLYEFNREISKFRFIESGNNLNEPQPQAPAPGAYWTGRPLRSEFARLEESGAFIPLPTDRDITDLISEDRDGTESPLF